MKIKQIEIKDFGSIYRKTIAFSPDMNVLYTEKERTRREIQAFIESMLFGRMFLMQGYSGLRVAGATTG